MSLPQSVRGRRTPMRAGEAATYIASSFETCYGHWSGD